MKLKTYMDLDQLADCYTGDWRSDWAEDAGNEIESLCGELQEHLEHTVMTPDDYEDMQTMADTLAEIGLALDGVEDFASWEIFSRTWKNYREYIVCD